MTKTQSLRTDAKLLDRIAKQFRKQAQRQAAQGSIFTAETLTIRAMEHEAMAAQLRCDAINHETEESQ